MDKEFIIKEDLLTGIANYLSEKPFKEVQQLMTGIQTQVRLAPPVEKPAKVEKEAPKEV